jgi:hypothetical protein
VAQSSLVTKLRLQAVLHPLILNAPAGYASALGELPAGVALAISPEGEHDFVQLFIKENADFGRLGPTALEAISYDGLFWLCYPKKSGNIKSDLSREAVWKLMQGSGIRPVTQISIDETWSALRFRPEEKVGQ